MDCLVEMGTCPSSCFKLEDAAKIQISKKRDRVVMVAYLLLYLPPI